MKGHKCKQVDFKVALSSSWGVGNHGEEHSGKQSKEKLNKSHVSAQDGHWKDLGLKIHHPFQEALKKHIAFRDGIHTARS